jgi:hypothetical protein
MRNLTKFGLVAVITMAFWNPGTTCAAQSRPSGSYQQTCRDIGVNGSGLHATCKDTNGNWQSTQLADYQNCTSEIVNDNGTLRCNGGNGYNNGNYNNGNYNNGGYQNGNGPAGSYNQTCRNIRTRGNTLEADCQTRGGQWNRTSLRNYQGCGEITNDNGTLRCTGGGGYNNGGNYNGGRGRDRDDGDRNDQNNRPGGYYNNGQGGYQGGVPGGSYTQTCQDIRVSGNTLKANCQKTNGRYSKTSLDNFNQCSEISNNNGKLRCNR